MTVDGLSPSRWRPVVARVVTDAAGHIETCAIDTSSGFVALDDAACRYTRDRLSLAAPLDRNGHAVRAMRLVRIGFSTSAGT